MKDSSSIHVKFDYSEAASAKKSMLLCEKSFLEIIKRMRNYNDLRRKEFILKSRAKKNILEVKQIVEEIEKELPKQEATKFKHKMSQEFTINHELQPSIQEKELTADDLLRMQQIELRKEKEVSAKQRKNHELEKELEDIKEKLARLG